MPYKHHTYGINCDFEEVFQQESIDVDDFESKFFEISSQVSSYYLFKVTISGK